MFKKTILLSALIGSLLLLPTITTANSDKGGKLGVGIQSSWPSYGLSVKYDMTDDITVQGTLGALGTVTNVGGRLLYKFKKEPNYDLYGFGSVGMYKYSSGFIDESVFGFGAGAGIEYDLSKELDIPITISGEAGMSVVNFDQYAGFSSFGLGVGVHYWLDK